MRLKVESTSNNNSISSGGVRQDAHCGGWAEGVDPCCGVGWTLEEKVGRGVLPLLEAVLAYVEESATPMGKR